MTQAQAPVAAPKTSGMAIASLVCGILGFCTAGIGGLVGLVLGIVAIAKINASNGALGGRGLSVAGIIVSALGLVVGAVLALSAIFFGLCTARVASHTAHVTSRFQQEAKVDTTRAIIMEVESALDVYNAHVGHYPTEDEGGLAALRTKPNFKTADASANWHGPYLKKIPVDAWGRPLHYELLPAAAGGGAATETVHIWSDGPDGRSGTADDIKNWSDETTGQ